MMSLLIWAVGMLPISAQVVIRDVHRNIGYVDRNGDTIVPPRYDDIGARAQFQNGIAIVAFGGRYGVIDSLGNPVTKAVWDQVEHTEGGFLTEKGQHVYLFRKNGTPLVEEAFEQVFYMMAYRFTSGYAVVKRHELFGVIDTSGRTVVPIEFDWVEIFSKPPFMVQKGGLYYYYDGFGRNLFSRGFDCAYGFWIELTVANSGATDVGEECHGGVWYLLSDAGSMIDSFAFDHVSPVNDSGYAAFRDTNGLWGIIDRFGDVVCSARFSWAHPPEEGLIPACNGEGCGYANLSGEWVLAPEYEYVGPFYKRNAHVTLKDGRPAKIDYSGKILEVEEDDWPP